MFMMSDQFLPPPGLDHALPDNLSREQLVALWLDLLDASDQLLLAGIQARLPPGGDVQGAYREWCEQHAREHLAMLERMAERFNRLKAGNGVVSSS